MIITVKFNGLIELSEFERAAQEFGRIVNTYEGKPFRVFVDLMDSKVLKPEVAEAFIQAQNFAVEAGMEKDVFATDMLLLQCK
ncbi:hypothetical protein [Reichenbachiella versicolor]|uniref:hypothetical protein n=1 Tax=Reichenbachiella versicolor TaxID=1821036 RepID=UPI000D6E4B38|nr:hypothetical protein [Reichenbachiella versicolor]